jgi:hypothetical protein
MILRFQIHDSVNALSCENIRADFYMFVKVANQEKEVRTAKLR